MDLDIKPSTASLRVTSKPSSLIVSSPTRQLPPIPHSQSNGAADQLVRDGQLTGMVLNQCKKEVEESMQHLLFEAQTTESKIQRGIDTLWQCMQDIIHQRSQEMDRKWSCMKSELDDTKNKLTRLTNQESALVQQNAKTCMQLSAEEKQRKKLEEQLVELNHLLNDKKCEVKKTSAESIEKEKSHFTENNNLKQQLNQKDKMLKEYQSQIMKLTDRMNKLSKDLSIEKTTSEKSHKSTTDLLTQQTAENRKLLLELSKLKGQMSSINSLLANKKEENKKLELQLQSQLDDHNLTLARIDKDHSVTVQELRAQISALQNELEKIQLTYITETENLKKQLIDAHRTIAELASNKQESGNDYVEARIRFLQHQNRQEKVKLVNKKSSKKN